MNQSTVELDEQRKGSTPVRDPVFNRKFEQWWAEHKHLFPKDTQPWVARSCFAAGQQAGHA